MHFLALKTETYSFWWFENENPIKYAYANRTRTRLFWPRQVPSKVKQWSWHSYIMHKPWHKWTILTHNLQRIEYGLDASPPPQLVTEAGPWASPSIAIFYHHQQHGGTWWMHYNQQHFCFIRTPVVVKVCHPCKVRPIKMPLYKTWIPILPILRDVNKNLTPKD